MATNKEKKSNLLLQSRRFTLNALGDTQEAFTRVLDLNASEIYSQQNLIPTSSLPFSGSSQHEETSGVIKYWYRHKLTKGNDGTNEAWFFLDPTGSADGITPQLINSDQKTDFISPKYSEAALEMLMLKMLHLVIISESLSLQILLNRVQEMYVL